MVYWVLRRKKQYVDEIDCFDSNTETSGCFATNVYFSSYSHEKFHRNKQKQFNWQFVKFRNEVFAL